MTQRDWRSLPAAAKDQALVWHSRLTGADVSDDDYAAFASWVAADADNAAAIEWVESIDQRVERAFSNRAVESLQARQPSRRSARIVSRLASWRYSALAASLAAIFVFGTFAVVNLFAPAARIEEFAGVDAPKNIVLEDGTDVMLAPGASMKAQIDGRHRRIRDFKGAGYFHVASDRKRPFTIAMDGKIVTVVGTQFEVRSFSKKQTVSVVEGTVRVSDTKPNRDAPLKLTAGEMVTISRNGDRKQVVSNVNVNEIASWRDGALEFSNEPLSHVLDALNELYGSATFVDKTTVDPPLRFNGVLQVTDPAVVSKRLEELLPVKVENVNGRFWLTQTDQPASGRKNDD